MPETANHPFIQSIISRRQQGVPPSMGGSGSISAALSNEVKRAILRTRWLLNGLAGAVNPLVLAVLGPVKTAARPRLNSNESLYATTYEIQAVTNCEEVLKRINILNRVVVRKDGSHREPCNPMAMLHRDLQCANSFPTF
jgi:hypothetical protein